MCVNHAWGSVQIFAASIIGSAARGVPGLAEAPACNNPCPLDWGAQRQFAVGESGEGEADAGAGGGADQEELVDPVPIPVPGGELGGGAPHGERGGHIRITPGEGGGRGANQAGRLEGADERRPRSSDPHFEACGGGSDQDVGVQRLKEGG